MISIGSDHMGYPLKEKVAEKLRAAGIAFHDVGTHRGEKGHYPAYAEMVARGVLDGGCEKGLLFCGSGQGVCMAANKFAGIRSAWSNTVEAARLSREHNNANVLAMGANFTDPETAFAIIKTFLETEYLGGRHERKLALIARIEVEGTCLPYSAYS